MCCLPTCAQGSSATVTRVVGYGAFWTVWVLLGVLCIWGWLCWTFPLYLQDSGYGGVPIAGHAHGAEVGGSIICVTLGDFTGLHKSAPYVFWVMEVIPFM